MTDPTARALELEFEVLEAIVENSRMVGRGYKAIEAIRKAISQLEAQKVDVEALKRECVDYCTKSYWRSFNDVALISKTIDHLHSRNLIKGETR